MKKVNLFEWEMLSAIPFFGVCIVKKVKMEPFHHVRPTICKWDRLYVAMWLLLLIGKLCFCVRVYYILFNTINNVEQNE